MTSAKKHKRPHQSERQHNAEHTQQAETNAEHTQQAETAEPSVHAEHDLSNLPPHPMPDDAHTLSAHPQIETDHQLQAHEAPVMLELSAPAEIAETHLLPPHDAARPPSDLGPWTQTEEAFLLEAAEYLEHPSFLMRVAEKLGKPLEWVVSQLPDVAHQAAHKALEKALEIAVMTLPEQVDTPAEPLPEADWTPTLHTLATAVSGALGGAFGVAGLAVELPFSTGVIMRSIASIAQSYGEDIRDPAVQLECLAVLSHGGPPDAQDSMDSAYLTSRASLTVLLREASTFMARVSARELAEAVAKGTAPRVLVLLAQIANRFGVVVSQKFFAQALPLIGAVGGGFVNASFADHFQRVARYHFGIRSLERRYGSTLVLDAYKKALNP